MHLLGEFIMEESAREKRSDMLASILEFKRMEKLKREQASISEMNNQMAEKEFKNRQKEINDKKENVVPVAPAPKKKAAETHKPIDYLSRIEARHASSSGTAVTKDFLSKVEKNQKIPAKPVVSKPTVTTVKKQEVVPVMSAAEMKEQARIQRDIGAINEKADCLEKKVAVIETKMQSMDSKLDKLLKLLK